MAYSIGAYGTGADATRRTSAVSPTLTYTGVPEVGPVTTTPLSYGGSTGGTGFLTKVGNAADYVLGTLVGSSSTSSTSSTGGVSPAAAYAQYGETLRQGGMVTPTITQGQIDGSTGFVDVLKAGLGAVLANMGAQGDVAQPVAQPVAYQPTGGIAGLSLPMIAGIAVVGVALYAASK